MRKKILCLLAAGTLLALTVFCCTFIPFLQQCEDISGRVIRLHVLADSDEEEAQALKLAVRDRLLEEAKAYLDVTNASKSEAESQLQQLLPVLKECAEEELRAHGCDLPVHLELADTFFTTRTYGSYTLPAGRYEALRVVIGSGQGQNWWCIVFPPLCISPSLGTSEVQLSAVLPEDELEIVSDYPQYEFRFKLVEWIESLLEQWRGN